LGKRKRKKVREEHAFGGRIKIGTKRTIGKETRGKKRVGKV